MRVAVVGVGASGLATALAITDQGPGSLDLTLFDQQFKDPDRSARGFAYQADRSGPLLNAPMSMMSIRPDDDQDFARWVRRTGRCNGVFTSRSVFGDYLSDCLDSLKRQWVARPGTLHCVPSNATAVSRSVNGRFSVATAMAHFDGFDAVFLCVGWNERSAAADGCVPAYPLDETILRAMSASHVGVIGTGLGAVDVARGLLSSGYRGTITLASRRGLLPGPRIAKRISPRILTRERLHGFGALDLGAGLGLVEREAQEQGISLETPRRFLRGEVGPRESLRIDVETQDWRALFVALCDEVMADAWHLFDDASRRVFLRWLHPYFQSWCNPMPPSTARMLASAMDSGQLIVGRGLRIASSQRMMFMNGEVRDVDVVVSARRSSSESVANMDDAVVQSLLNGGLAMRDVFGGLRVNYGTWRIIAPGGAHLPIYAIGSLAQGARYYVNALDSIVRTIPEAVNDALASYA